MNSKRRQRHTRQTLENRAFRHDHAIILNQWDPLISPRHQITPSILRRPLSRVGIDIDIPRRHPQQHLILREIINLILGVLVCLPRRS